MAQSWNKIKIALENGEFVEAQAPEIVSASRSTDIPAFYAEWFFHRLRKGYSTWKNPFNGKTSYVSYNNTRFIVFWSKNPRPLLQYLDELDERNIGCYIQYSLNDYEKEGLEKRVPKLETRIDTFKQLVDRLGIGHVIWRFDPLILTDTIGVEDLIQKIINIGDQLKGYTEKLVFSFADIGIYRKVANNLKANNVNVREWDEAQMRAFASKLSVVNKEYGWNYELATCGEKICLEEYGIQHNHCIDYNLIVKLANHDRTLMNFIGASIKTRSMNLYGEYDPLPTNAIELADGRYVVRDGGQREACGCMRSKDIGQYDTCIHQCEYCYANTNKQTAMMNWQKYQQDKTKETII